jgi:hypothetical protein
VTLLAQLIDGEALLRVVIASLVAGGGLTIAFSTLVVFATRAAEMRRAGHRVWAAGLTAVSLVAVVVCVGLVAFGLHIMVSD